MLFLAVADVDADRLQDCELAAGLFELRPGLFLIEAEPSQSVLYHAIKRRLPPGAPLLVARLDGDPKFKGMAEGALAWLRSEARV